MKLVVDFDDVLFDTKKLKDAFFAVLQQRGVRDPEGQYGFERKNDRPFSLKLFMGRIAEEENIDDVDSMYEEVMSRCAEWRNDELIEVVQKAGKDNCYIVTSGDDEFQKDKIVRSDVGSFFREIIVVPGSKNRTIEALCALYPHEDVIFIDDKHRFFNDIAMETCPNLKTVLYNKHGLDNLRAEIEESMKAEHEKMEHNKGNGGPTMK